MKVNFIILTYNRPIVLRKCLETVFNNTEIIPSETFVIDDGSEPDMRMALADYCTKNSRNDSPINLSLAGKNYGIGYTFEKAYNIMRQNEDDDVLFAIIESDYIWRKGWLEDVIAVFEASPNTISIAGVDHPDMVDKNKTHGTFVDLMKEQFGEDIESRDNLYKEFIINTSRGDIKVRPVSNSCGCQIIHWGRLKKILKDGDLTHGLTPFSTENFWKWMDRAFHKNGTGDRRYASDGHMSCTLTYFAEKWMKHSNIDITKNFGMLSISDYSISQHICGKGVNGMIVPEGQTFVISPTWKDEYLEKDPRK